MHTKLKYIELKIFTSKFLYQMFLELKSDTSIEKLNELYISIRYKTTNEIRAAKFKVDLKE